MEAYLRYGNAEAFFARFDLPTVPYVQSALPSINIDITTGQPLTSYVAPTFNATIAALETFLSQTEKYASFMLPGYWDFPNGSAIPSDLLLPFGDFARKYEIEAAIPVMEVVSNVGVGGIEDILTFYVMIAFGKPVTEEFLANDLFVPQNASNTVLYDRALQLLQADVLLSSNVTSAERNSTGVQLVVQSQDGCQKLIKAKRLLFTPPPSLKNLAPFGPDAQEVAAFSTWTPTWLFAAVARIPVIPSNYSVSYLAPAGAPSNYLATRNYPWTLSFTPAPTGENLWEVLLAANYSLTHDEAKALITTAVQNATAAGSFGAASTTNGTEVDFLAFVDHNSVLWRQSAEQLRGGIVQEIYALQGHLSTWYTGGLWSEDYSGNVWAFTDSLLPRLIKSL